MVSSREHRGTNISTQLISCQEKNETESRTALSTKVPAWEFHTPKEGWLVYVEQDDAFMLYSGTAWTFDFKLAGIPQFAGTNTTGAGSASLGANCPAVAPTAPYTWIQVKTADGSTAYVPAWK